MDGHRKPVPPSRLMEAMRGNLLAADCPSRDVLQHMTSRWGVLVLIALEGGSHRFSALRRTIGGVSERMLAQTLHLLEADGLISRHAFDVVPPHVEYALTPLGEGAAVHVRQMTDWIEDNIGAVLAYRQDRAGQDNKG